MARKNLNEQIELAQQRIQDEQKRLKKLQAQQSEKDRKARNHRLCKRHGLIESLLPDTITLTDEQFEQFVKQHIANQHGRRALANLVAQGAESATTGTDTNSTSGNISAKSEQNASANSKPQGATA